MSSEVVVEARSVGKDYSLGRSGRTTSLAEIVSTRVRHPFARRRVRERFTALDDVSFDIERGEVVGVIGRNGAGKSTLLKILSRITYPSRGEVRILGRVGCLLEVGTGFHPELTGRENVYLNGAILGMRRRTIDARYDEITDFAGIPGFLDTPVKRYSSGMRVRLAFAVAAHLEPEILIVDEVLSVGDIGFQAQCLAKMRSIALDGGRTVLYVSHKLETVEHLCPRTMVIEEGHVTFDGETEEALTHYLGTIPHADRGATAGVFDLAGADRSRGGYNVVFRRLEFRPGGGTPTDTIRMGDRLVVQITAEALDRVPKPVLQVSVRSGTGHFLARISTQMLPLRTPYPRRHEETIVLDIPSLPLTPGEYDLSLLLRDGDGNIVDRVRTAAMFTVVSADALGTGYRFTTNDGYFIVPWSWEIRPSGGAE